MNTHGTEENFHRELSALLPRLRRFARNLTRDVYDADDVVQLALERALARADQRDAAMRLDGWMFKIIRNAWIDEVRSRGRRGKIFLDAEAGEAVGEDTLERAGDLLSVHAALLKLPEEQRVVVGLVLVEGLPYKEAADVLEIPIGTLTSRLARARAALQAMLEPPSGERT